MLFKYKLRLKQIFNPLKAVPNHNASDDKSVSILKEAQECEWGEGGGESPLLKILFIFGGNQTSQVL